MVYPVDAVLFDLDGTLLDTAKDLAHSLNLVLTANGSATLPYEQIRVKVSHGGSALIRLGFGLQAGDAGFQALLTQLLDTYTDNISNKTHPFSGIMELLAVIEARGLKWGVVTNKPSRFTIPLLQQQTLYERAASVVCGDSLRNRKPHPEPMYWACEQMGVPPQHCLVIGDAERDIEAGRNAGMRTAVALYGYIDADEDPYSWKADRYIHTPLEILPWIDSIIET